MRLRTDAGLCGENSRFQSGLYASTLAFGFLSTSDCLRFTSLLRPQGDQGLDANGPKARN